MRQVGLRQVGSMHPLVSTLQQALLPLQTSRPLKLCIAFSGGLDSRVLLHLAWQLKTQHLAQFELSALHIHHGLSSQADAWADFCQATCKAYALPFHMIVVQPQKEAGASLEARARQARYRAFQQHLSPQELLVQAHHRKDQAETLLLRLLRGAGTQGLGCIPLKRPLGAGQLLRPLLHLPKEQLQAFAQEQALTWVEDASNQEDYFDRNFIRLKLLPLLQQRFPAAEKNFALVTKLAKESQQLHQDLAALDLQKLAVDNHSLSLTGLNQLADYRQRNLLRYWLEQRGLPLPGQHLWAQLQCLCHAKAAAQPLVEWGAAKNRVQARRYKDRLYIQDAAEFQPLAPNWCITWNNQAPLETPYGWLYWQLRSSVTGEIPQSLQVSSRREGASLRLDKRGRRDVKRLLQESQLPPWKRQQLAFIWHQGELIAVGDILIAQGWQWAATRI